MISYFCLDLYGYVFLGEMVGTLLLVFLGNSINATNSFKKAFGFKSGWMFTNLGWGAGAAIAVLFSMFIETVGSQVAYEQTHILMNFSYGLINPSFDFTMFISGMWPTQIGWLPAFFLLLICLTAQFVGAVIGQIFVDFIYWNHFKTATLIQIKMMHCTHNFHRDEWGRNMFTEFAAATINISVDVVIAGFESTSINSSLWVPFVVGLTLAVIRSAIGSSAFAANPARDLGPRFVFLLLPLGKLGFDKVEQIKEFDINYTLLVPVLSPILGGIFVGCCCWLMPYHIEHYVNSIYIRNPFRAFLNR